VVAAPLLLWRVRSVTLAAVESRAFPRAASALTSDLKMTANVRFGALAILLLVACNRPDADLFSDVPLSNANTAGVGGAQSTGSVTSSGGSAAANGGSGSVGAEPVVAGNAPTAGGPVGNDAGGGPTPPEPPGTAGAPDGAGGQAEPDPPAEPVCGNGILEAGEQCDDSGHAGQDGCDATCKVVCSHFGSGTAESEDHHCYNGYDAADFEGGQADCVKRGGHLATISSAAENKIARTFVNNSKWLGGLEDVSSAAKGTGDYTWLTGEPFTYTNWAQGEPNQAKVRCAESNGPISASCYEHCVSMDGEGTWSDARCELSDGYLCEWEPAGTKP